MLHPLELMLASLDPDLQKWSAQLLRVLSCDDIALESVANAHGILASAVKLLRSQPQDMTLEAMQAQVSCQ